MIRNYLGILFHRIKARTSFHWIQIPVSHDQCFRKLPFQLPQQSKQSSFLLQCTRIFRFPVRIQSSLITNTNRMGIVIPAMCSDLFKRSSPVDFSVPCDIDMIANITETIFLVMILSASFRRIGLSFRRGTAMNDN